MTSLRMFGSLALAMWGSTPALAAIEYYDTTVTATLVDDLSFGQCMAKLATPPGVGTTADCGGEWVTFSCSGDYNSRALAERKFSAAQLALVTGNTVTIVVDDTKKHNGYCFAIRIDNT